MPTRVQYQHSAAKPVLIFSENTMLYHVLYMIKISQKANSQ